ncbi:MAG: class I SAM-dependent methyltransferase [Thalassovita sp.]
MSDPSKSKPADITGSISGDTEGLRSKTVSDFGEQWTYFTENDGYYASDEFFADLVGPMLTPEDFNGITCAEIGAGTGNIAAMSLRAGASHFTAVEPSNAVGPLRENLAEFGTRASVAHVLGENIPRDDFDMVMSIGVLHHIPQPDPVVKAAFEAIKPGGRMFIWLYGKEGNAAYLAVALPMRAITRRLPIPVLSGLSYLLDGILMPLVFLARRGIKVPLSDYLRDVYGKLAASDRRVVIVDQLKPAWALYYTEDEARDLLERAGFENVSLHHRHGYSWSVLGQKPKA